MKLFVKFGFVFCMALMVLAIGGCSSGSSDSSEVGVGSGEAAELEAQNLPFDLCQNLTPARRISWIKE